MRLVTFLFVVSILFDYGATLPCMTAESKQDFTKTRNALKSLKSYLSKTVSTLQSQINTINGKVKTLDKDLIAIEQNLKGRKWRKYKDHCYYFGTDIVIWTTAERRCREIGGYLAKIDDSSEQGWVYKEAMKTKKNKNFWLGIIDIDNTDWRWIYDQTRPNYKFWYPGVPYPASSNLSKTFNCGIMRHNNGGRWHNYPCGNGYHYICESNFCFS